MISIYHKTLEELRSGSHVVLATVIRTSGSTPQKPGSSALFGEEGLIAGTVGGGILEGEARHIAESVLISGVSNHYYFNLNSDNGEDGAICGGDAVVLIDAEPGAHLKALENMEISMSQRAGGHLMTTVGKDTERGMILNRNWITDNGLNSLPVEFDPQSREFITTQLSGQVGSGFTEFELPSTSPSLHEIVFVESIGPLPQLVITGGGHIGKALAHLGRLLEFEITVIDDRQEFANPENIPDADHFVVGDIGKAMSELKIGPDTYIVLVNRGHNHDTKALRLCIGSEFAYLGMIGSYRKVGIMKKRFLEEGWATKEQWSSIHTPIGLPIGSISVQEIALSIAAQLVSVRQTNKRNNAG